MVGFVSKNVNPKGKKTGDCVVRALSLALGEPYEKVYRELFDLSLRTGYIVNDKHIEEKYLASRGFVKHKQPKKSNGTKYRIGEIDAVCRNDVIVISCAHHLTVVIDGNVLDTWDCRSKCVSNYYTLDRKRT